MVCAFWGEWDGLPSRDGERVAQLGERNGLVAGGLELPGAHPAPLAACMN